MASQRDRAARREPGSMIIAACLGRDRKAADAADRRRAKARARKRKQRRRQKGDRHTFTVPITVDFTLASELADRGFIGDWDLEDRAAVQVALQTYLDQRKKYE
jgi:hypothetical protein